MITRTLTITSTTKPRMMSWFERIVQSHRNTCLFWCPFVTTRLAIYHSYIGICIRLLLGQRMHIPYLGTHHKMKESLWKLIVCEMHLVRYVDLNIQKKNFELVFPSATQQISHNRTFVASGSFQCTFSQNLIESLTSLVESFIVRIDLPIVSTIECRVCDKIL